MFKRIDKNACEIKLSWECGVSSIFNMAYLSPYLVNKTNKDLRISIFQPREIDMGVFHLLQSAHVNFADHMIFSTAHNACPMIFNPNFSNMIAHKLNEL